MGVVALRGLWGVWQEQSWHHSSHCHSTPEGGGTARAGLCRVGTALLWPQAAGVSCQCASVVAASQVGEAAPETAWVGD